MMYLFLAQSFAATCCLYAYWRERENHLTTAIDRDARTGDASRQTMIIGELREGLKLRQLAIDTLSSEMHLHARTAGLRIEALEAQIERERIEAGKINKNRLKLVAALSEVSNKLHASRNCKLKTEISNIMVEI